MDRRRAISGGSNGRINCCCCWVKAAIPLPLGLFDRRFGDGVSGGLPGRDGAQTMCSGVTESPLTERFSLPSIKLSNSIRKCSAEMADDKLNERSLTPGDILLTDRSNGVDVSLQK